MTLPPNLLPELYLWLAALIQIPILAWASRVAPWRKILSVPIRQHLLLGSALFLVLLWLSSAKLDGGLRMHFLGITVVSLTVGFRFALLIGALAQIFMVVLGQAEWPQWLANCLLNVSLPVIATAVVLQLAKRYGPQNPFVFMLGVGFFGGALTMLQMVLCTLLVLALAGQQSILRQWEPALLPLVMLPEGFVNGAVLSGLVVYAPHWLKTYEEQ